MPFRYLEDLATADAAFEAVGDTVEEMFLAAAEASLGVMIEDPGSIPKKEEFAFRLEQENLEMLLFEFLQELIYSKDARGLLLSVYSVRIETGSKSTALKAKAWCVPLAQVRQRLLTDVKAVTLYRFAIKHVDGLWKATVVLDI